MLVMEVQVCTCCIQVWPRRGEELSCWQVLRADRTGICRKDEGYCCRRYGRHTVEPVPGHKTEGRPNRDRDRLVRIQIVGDLRPGGLALRLPVAAT